MKQSKNMTRIDITLAVVLAVFCVLSFAIPFFKNSVFWISLIAGVVAIGVQAYVMRSAFAKGDGIRSKFYGWPIARVGVVYMAAQLVLSLVFMALSRWVPTWAALVLYAILLGAAAVGFIAVEATRDEIERQDVKLKKDVRRMRALQSKAASLVEQCDDSATKAVLEQLSDVLHYSDPVSNETTVALEDELVNYVDELQNALTQGEFETVTALCKKTMPILTQRNQLCKQNK